MAALLVAFLIAAGCARTDPEAALRDTMQEIQAAIEGRNPAAMQQHLADDFIGNDGLDRDGARRMAAAYLLRHREVGIDIGPADVEVTGSSATARFTAMLRGGAGRVLPDAANAYEVRTGWRLEGSDWKLVSLEWKPLL